MVSKRNLQDVLDRGGRVVTDQWILWDPWNSWRRKWIEKLERVKRVQWWSHLQFVTQYFASFIIHIIWLFESCLHVGIVKSPMIKSFCNFDATGLYSLTGRLFKACPHELAWWRNMFYLFWESSKKGLIWWIDAVYQRHQTGVSMYQSDTWFQCISLRDQRHQCW